ncbi:MAG: hypothetical protein ACM30I_13085 [Gemmatimonas sp.]
MMTSKSVETLIDLVEIKLSCLEVWDREDARERRALEIALHELIAMRGAKATAGAEITTLRPATAA